MTCFQIKNLLLQTLQSNYEISFSISAQERVVLTGSSGLGKTSLLRKITGLDPISAGELWLGEQKISLLPTNKRRVGLVFQEQALFWGQTVEQNLMFGMKAQKIGTHKSRQEVIGQWLEKAQLSNHRKTAVDFLSGGEKQRVAILRSLLAKPLLLLMDEPFTGLDIVLKQKLYEEIKLWQQKYCVPILLTSHDPQDIQEFATRKEALEEYRML